MHKDTPMPLKKEALRPTGGTTAGHARPRQSDPRAERCKASSCSRPRTVLVNMDSDADDTVAACVNYLAEAGHRVIAITADAGVPHVIANATANGRVVTLSGSDMNAASLRSAIKSLPPLFRCVDAAVNILHLPARPISLLDADPRRSDPNPAASLDRLLNATRAAMPGLLASERGHVIAVTLTTLNEGNLADEAHASALCKALRREFDDLGVRFTRIAVGPMQRRHDMKSDQGNRPRFNGVEQGVLAPADVAQAVAWTLAQPDHVAVRELLICPAPSGQPALSPREREVLEWTACGKTSEEIACILALSVSAVNFHVRSLLVKLQSCNKTAAVARAALLGMLI